MAMEINAGRPHTSTGRCCSQFIYSVHIPMISYFRWSGKLELMEQRVLAGLGKNFAEFTLQVMSILLAIFSYNTGTGNSVTLVVRVVKPDDFYRIWIRPRIRVLL
jgi:hypothetical protein